MRIRSYGLLTRAALGVLAVALAWCLGAAPRARAASPTLSIVAIGDSITYEGNATSTGWLAIYASHLGKETGRTPQIHDFGIPGASSGEILDALRTHDDLRSALSHADLVTYQAGINDFFRARTSYIAGNCSGADNQDCLRSMVQHFDANWDALVSEIAALAPHAAKRTMNIYYSTIKYDTDHGDATTLNGYVRQINQHIAANPGAPLVDAHQIYNGGGDGDPAAKGYLLADAVHPSWLGHLVIANVLDAVGYPEFGGPQRSAPTAVSVLRSTPAPAHHSGAGSRTWLIAALGTVALLAAIAVSAVALARRRGRGTA